MEMKYLIVIPLLLSFYSDTFAQSIGNPCSTLISDFCNKAQFLECTATYKDQPLVVEGTCQCPENTHHEGGICRKDAGATCDAVTDEINCGRNAECKNSKCVCDDGSGPTLKGNGKLCVKTYGVECNAADNPCDSTAGFTCDLDQGIRKCLCSSGFIYSQDRKKCVILPGGNCPSAEKDNNCDDNSVCNAGSPSRCDCLPGFTPWNLGGSGDSRCYLAWNETCEQTGDKTGCSPYEKTLCDPTSHRCECKPSTKPALYAYGVRCKSLSGARCDSIDDCFTGMSCIPTTELGTSLCLCNPPLVELPDKTCKRVGQIDESIIQPNYGDLCSTDINCDASRFLYCNRTDTVSGYGVCHCKSGSIRENNECRMRLNEDCSGNRNCINNAACVEDKCECDKGFSSSPDGQSCLGGNGASCSFALNACRVDQGLLCQGSTCGCPAGQIWLAEKSHCVALLSGNCTENPDLCSKNSHCTKAGICDCDEGFSHLSYTPLTKRRCLRTYEQNCSAADPCNEYNFLVCGDEGQCECKYPLQQRFDPEEGRCVGISGGACGVLPENTITIDGASVSRDLTCHRDAECKMDLEGISRCVCKADPSIEAGESCTSSSTNDVGTIPVPIFVLTILTMFSMISLLNYC